MPEEKMLPAEFIANFKRMMEAVHETATKSTFWHAATPAGDQYSPENHNKSEKIMLMVSELAEAQDGLRHGNPPSDKIPEFSNVEEEMADCVIRIMDFCEAYGYDLAGAIVAKDKMNKTRAPKHGKEF